MKINWRKIFDWTISDVRGPERFYSGSSNHFRGYAVVVSYVHHGELVYLFRYDDETMYSEYQGPLDAAITAFNDFKAQMHRQQAKKQNKPKGKNMKIDWKHLLNWDIDVVGGPAAIYGSDGRIAGYKVIVKYKHHGSNEFFFDVNTEHYYTMYNGPEDAAKQTYKSYVAKMNQQKARTVARQK